MVMLLNQLNLNSLHVLSVVSKRKNMTQAAKELGMTQSGVSQHMSNLERDLGVPLFIRDKKKLIPTKLCHDLEKLLDNTYSELEKTFYKYSDDNNYLSGNIVIGVPIEFGNNILFKKLAIFSKKYPHITFRVRFGLGFEMNRFLNQGEIDFAFTDGVLPSSSVNSINVYQEQLVLCCSKKYIEDNKQFRIETQKEFKRQKYIAYFHEGTILHAWFKKAMGYSFKELDIVVTTEDAQGVMAFIQNHMGLGVVPRHMVLNRDDIIVFNPQKNDVLNDITFSFIEKRIEEPLLQSFYRFILDSFNLS